MDPIAASVAKVAFSISDYKVYKTDNWSTGTTDFAETI